MATPENGEAGEFSPGTSGEVPEKSSQDSQSSRGSQPLSSSQEDRGERPSSSTGPQFPSPAAAAMFWVNRATVVVVSMVAPIIGGSMLDRWLGTGFLTLLGIAIGMFLGIGQLLLLTRNVR